MSGRQKAKGPYTVLDGPCQEWDCTIKHMHEVYDQDGESVLTVAGYESACDAAMALNAADRKATLRERARVRAKAKKARGR